MSRRPDPWQCPSPCEQRLQVWIASEGLLGYRNGLGQAIESCARQYRANFLFRERTTNRLPAAVCCALIKNSRFVNASHTSVTFRTNDLRKAIQCFAPSTSGKRQSLRPNGGYAMFVDRIKSPRCPKCGAMMSLRIIEPERPGFDSRTFECPKCYDTETFVASISPERNAATVTPAWP